MTAYKELIQNASKAITQAQINEQKEKDRIWNTFVQMKLRRSPPDSTAHYYRKQLQ